MAKKVIKTDPHFLGETPLNFDDLDVEQISAKTDKEKATLFLEKYKKIVKPFTVYADFFKRDKNVDLTLALIKRFYIKLVLNGDWTEKKFVASINNILANNGIFSERNLKENGLNFDNGNLQNRKRGRRRRL